MSSTAQSNDIADQWTGVGLRFPLRPGSETLSIERIGGMELIRQSITTILDTQPGERIMLPSFGCGLLRYLMEPNTLGTRTSMEQDIVQALSQWEPRIRLTNVAVTPGEDPSLLWIDISYVRLADLRPDNLVYPFYLK
ncbi:GPW/gp25 family protein [Pseudarthrobacter sulfonivorans]|uniref:GPW/gp25 family protein n=1 Tax=Pseudarthrobacter sulfonivorans TaxID=121292 RepID=UPI00210328C5|nr:GPW/gp25 family protein [Pseudarthrobacter sulfonivorans]